MVQYFKNYDILITPSTAVSAFELGKMFPAKIAGRAASPVEWMSFTHPFNSTGNPAAPIPCGWTSEGLPIGMQIMGNAMQDKLVLQAGHALQKTTNLPEVPA